MSLLITPRLGQALSLVHYLPHIVKLVRYLITLGPPYYRGFSSIGRASDLHSEGKEFESPNLQT